MKGEIIIIILLYLLAFVYSNGQPKENDYIDLIEHKSQLFNFFSSNNSKENDSNVGSDDGNDDDDDDDDDKKVLIICLIAGSVFVLAVIGVIFGLFIRSKITYDKLNEKINQISFSEERDNNRETKTEDLD